MNIKVNYILDTSAIIAYLSNEDGAEKISKLKQESSIPFIVFSELYYLMWNRKDRAEADRIYGIVKNWELPLLQPDERIIITAGRFKAVYKLGIADSYIAAFAFSKALPLVTKDPDYNALKWEIEIVNL